MKQSDLGLKLTIRRTRKREFLAATDRLVPWPERVAPIVPHAPDGRRGRPPLVVQMMLRIHFMQPGFTLSDPPMDKVLHDTPLFRDLAGQSWDGLLPNERTILRFRRLFDRHQLAVRIAAVVDCLRRGKNRMLTAGTGVDTTPTAAPFSTKNQAGKHEPEMRQTKNGDQWHFGMKAHIGVDAESGLVHTVMGTAADVNHVVQADGLLHGEETDVVGDAGDPCVQHRPDARNEVDWHTAMRLGKRQALDKIKPPDAQVDQIEQIRASERAKVAPRLKSSNASSVVSRSAVRD